MGSVCGGIPGQPRCCRVSLAQTIVDTLLDQSVRANLKVESPTAVERGEQQEERLQQLLDPSLQEEGGIADLLKFRNFGKKSLTELEELVADKNLNFGMDVAKYRLDED